MYTQLLKVMFCNFNFKRKHIITQKESINFNDVQTDTMSKRIIPRVNCTRIMGT